MGFKNQTGPKGRKIKGQKPLFEENSGAVPFLFPALSSGRSSARVLPDTNHHARSEHDER